LRNETESPAAQVAGFFIVPAQSKIFGSFNLSTMELIMSRPPKKFQLFMKKYPQIAEA
jgi:hypothetical protein